MLGYWKAGFHQQVKRLHGFHRNLPPALGRIGLTSKRNRLTCWCCADLSYGFLADFGFRRLKVPVFPGCQAINEARDESRQLPVPPVNLPVSAPADIVCMCGLLLAFADTLMSGFDDPLLSSAILMSTNILQRCINILLQLNFMRAILQGQKGGEYGYFRNS